MEEIQKRFHRAVKRRTELRGTQERLQGRLESAKSRLEEIQAKCRAKGVDPENLDELIDKVMKVYDERVSTIEQKIAEAEEELAPYLDEVIG